MGCVATRRHPLDKLAARGTRFTNAYTASPMRAALATGRAIHQTGHWDSATPYAGTPESWMHRLQEAGHETVSIGKLHFRSTADDNGFSTEILPMHVINIKAIQIMPDTRLTSFLDDCVGRILDALVRRLFDHGEMLGDHGLWACRCCHGR